MSRKSLSLAERAELRDLQVQTLMEVQNLTGCSAMELSDLLSGKYKSVEQIPSVDLRKLVEDLIAEGGPDDRRPLLLRFMQRFAPAEYQSSSFMFASSSSGLDEENRADRRHLNSSTLKPEDTSGAAIVISALPAHERLFVQAKRKQEVEETMYDNFVVEMLDIFVFLFVYTNLPTSSPVF